MARRPFIVPLVAAVVAATAAGCTSSGAPGPTGAAASARSAVGFTDQLCGRGGTLAKPGYPNTVPKLPGGASRLSGAGSTFVTPIMTAWARKYAQEAGVQVDYQSVGSGAGVQQTIAKTVDFGASDTPMKDDELARAKDPVLHVPLVLGAVAPAYRLDGIPSGLKFDGPTLGRIFAGEITHWNDPALVDLNPQADLPSTPITVVHRSDGSGTTAVWTDYLTKTSPEWVAKIGEGKSAAKDIAWPVGTGGKGNDGVAEQVKQTEGAIGYVELATVLDQHLGYGQVKNAHGRFVQPCTETITAGVALQPLPADLRTSLTNGPDQDAYPVTGTTYALLPQNQKDPATAAALVDFIAWVLSTGQDDAADLHYAPLGRSLQAQSAAKLKTLTVAGTPLFP
ncbi:phosphate ABC transporter substrate-binding protein PstS [Kitasatospora cineracea]|uniref:phosphate ABC transporter substrate-binding protein PstS n=1 Tax=Kitasatospora cineracea TaxID=88074 RepID=UPI0038039688